MANGRTPSHFLKGARVAMDDLCVDWRMTLCFIFALAAVLAPLMVLFGLKFGVMETMRARFLNDPTTLEITVLGNTDRDLGFFYSLSRRPDVAFVVPKTRSIAATLYLQKGADGRPGPAELVELIPTAKGDPLLAGLAQPDAVNEVVLSESLARKMDVQRGDQVQGFATRDINGSRQRADVVLTVVGVLEAQRFSRLGLFAPLRFLESVEDYRDGYAAPALGWTGAPRPNNRTSFASARIFSRSLDELPDLAAELEKLGIATKSRAADVKSILALDQGLRLGFWIVAGLGAVGFFVSLAASLWSNVERKRISLSVLSLLGMRRTGLIAFPLAQSIVIGAAGAGTAICFFFLATVVVDYAFSRVLGGTDSAVCRLLPHHMIIAFGATILFCASASCWAAVRVAGIQPSDGMRET